MNKLLKKLPSYIKPIVFPRQEPNPQDAVSNGIVSQIYSCGGLIYLDGGHSSNSLWVNFERDYARRVGLKVFEYDSDTDTLAIYNREPAALDVEIVVSKENKERVEELLTWMKESRSFEFKTRPVQLRLKEIPGFIAQLIDEQKPVIWFLDAHIHACAQTAMELEARDLYDEFIRHERFTYSPGEQELENFQTWLNDHSMYVRTSRDWQLIQSADPDIREIIDEYPIERSFGGGNRWAVDLVSSVNDETIDWNRADDLIVRTTYMLQMSWSLFENEEE